MRRNKGAVGGEKALTRLQPRPASTARTRACQAIADDFDKLTALRGYARRRPLQAPGSRPGHRNDEQSRRLKARACFWWPESSPLCLRPPDPRAYPVADEISL